LTSCLMALYLRKPQTPPDFLNLELLVPRKDRVISAFF
jgi:hypothetical protein